MSRPRFAVLLGVWVSAFVGAVSAAAQVGPLPFDLIDVADNPAASDHCGITFSYFDLDPTAHEETGGVSAADFDGDGLLDLFLPNNKGRPNRLYRNLGNGTFVDVAAARGVDDSASAGSSALFIDYDQDGDLDLLVISHLGHPTLVLGPHFRLFRNRGAAGGYSFTNVTASAGFVLGPTTKATNWGWVSGVCAGDYNHDGWSDLFISWNGSGNSQDQWRLMRNAPNPVPGDPGDPAYTPRIFIDVTPGSGLEGEYGGNPWQPMFWDVNRDGWPDLHIAQDFTLDLMFINNKNGTFTNVATGVGLNGDPPEFRNEMGTALGDPDQDLDHDLHTTNIGNLDRFYRNDSYKLQLSFTDIAQETGLNTSTFGWGTIFADLDNDGDLDHANVTGFEHDTGLQYSNLVHLNLYPETFGEARYVAWADVSAQVPDFSKLQTTFGDSARGLISLDYDLDGDLDVVVTRNHSKAGVFKNTLSSPDRWLQVDVVNSGGSLDITGTRVYLRHHRETLLREVFTGSSYLCQEPSRLHFGLGQPTYEDVVSTTGTTTSTVSGSSASSLLGQASTQTLGPPAVGGLKGAIRPTWLVVRWRDGACQIVMDPGQNALLTIVRSGVDDTGDINADGHLTSEDEALLLLAIEDLSAFEAAYPASPGCIVGDVNDDGVVDSDDLVAWAALPPH